jgi:uracil-DNA glycosylase family protein
MPLGKSDTLRPGAARWVPQGGGLAALRAAASACRGCELWEPATQAVFSSGHAHTLIALVGEQPGDVEDRQGVPFVGPAGRLLQRAIAASGIRPEDVYLTNAVKHFRYVPRGKRRIHATPEMEHIRACQPWLEAELRVVDPEVIVVLGATAAKSLLGPQFRVTRHRGEVMEIEATVGRRIFVPTIHPSAVLRAPDDQRAAAFEAFVDDLRVASAALTSR